MTDPNHNPPVANWGCGGITTGATGTALGTGKQNTADIQAASCTNSVAADLCTNWTWDMNGITYDDWFLPSKDEASLMCNNIGNNNILGLPNVAYMHCGDYVINPLGHWSSTENDIDTALETTSVLGSYISNKWSTMYVRAIRCFGGFC